MPPSALSAMRALNVLRSMKGAVIPCRQMATRRVNFGVGSNFRSLSTPPPFVEIPMPKLVPTMEDGVLSKWHVREGDEMQAGDLLCEVDVVGLNEDHKTDTVTLLIESHETGYIARRFAQEGSTVRVDHAIGVMVEDESDVAAFKDYVPADGPSRNSGSDVKTEDGRLFCWQAYLKEE